MLRRAVETLSGAIFSLMQQKNQEIDKIVIMEIELKSETSFPRFLGAFPAKI